MLTDVILSETTGVDLYELAVRQYHDLKVLYMSGYTNEVIAQRGGLSSDEHFVQKPFSTRDLAYRIREALR